MNSTSKQFAVSSSDYLVNKKSIRSESATWRTIGLPTISATESLFHHLNAGNFSSVYEKYSYVPYTGVKQTVKANSTNSIINSFMTTSVLSGQDLNKTKKTSENEKGINTVTILVVVSSCLLLWIIIIVIGLVRQRIERKNHLSSCKEGPSSNELERSHDSSSNVPVHIKARMIYQGLQSYDITNQVPNGVINTNHISQVTTRVHRPSINSFQENSGSNGHKKPHTFSDRDTFEPRNHCNNGNGTFPINPGVKIVVTEPVEGMKFENTDLTEESLVDTTNDTNSGQNGNTNSLIRFMGNGNIESSDKVSERKGVVNEGFDRNESFGSTEKKLEETTQL